MEGKQCPGYHIKNSTQGLDVIGNSIRTIRCGYGCDKTGSNGQKVTRVGCLSGSKQGWKNKGIKMGRGNCKHGKMVGSWDKG